MLKSIRAFFVGTVFVCSAVVMSSCNIGAIASVINSVLTSASASENASSASASASVASTQNSSSQGENSSVSSFSGSLSTSNSSAVGLPISKAQLESLFDADSFVSYKNFTFVNSSYNGESEAALKISNEGKIQVDVNKSRLVYTNYQDEGESYVLGLKTSSVTKTRYLSYDDNFFLFVTANENYFDATVTKKSDDLENYNDLINENFAFGLGSYFKVPSLDFDSIYSNLHYSPETGIFNLSVTMIEPMNPKVKMQVYVTSVADVSFTLSPTALRFSSLKINVLSTGPGFAGRNIMEITDIGSTSVIIPAEYSLASIATLNFFHKDAYIGSAYYLLNQNLSSSVEEVTKVVRDYSYVYSFSLPEKVTELNMRIDGAVSIQLKKLLSNPSNGQVVIEDWVNLVQEGAFDGRTFNTVSYTSSTSFAWNEFQEVTGLTTINYDGTEGVMNFLPFGQLFGTNTHTLSTINLGPNVNLLDSSWLTGFDNLSAVNVAEANQSFSSKNGVLYSKDGTTLIYVPAGLAKGGNFTVPEGVMYLSRYCFAGSVIATLNIPSSVQNIDQDAFTDAKINAFAINSGNSSYASDEIGAIYDKSYSQLLFVPKSVSGDYAVRSTVSAIGSVAFVGCNKITSVKFSKFIASVTFTSFVGCDALASFSADSENTSLIVIDDVVFSSDKSMLFVYPNAKKATSLTIPSETQAINGGGTEIFNSPYLASILVQEGNTSFTSINGVLYTYDKTGIVVIPHALSGSITLPKEINYAPAGLFKGSLESPLALTSIQVESGNTTFVSANGLLMTTSGTLVVCPQGYKGMVTIPANTNDVDLEAFAGCTQVTSIVFKGNLTYFDSHTMSSLQTVFLSETSDIFTAFTASSYVGDSTIKVCLYKESQPTENDMINWKYFWHYVNNVPTAW